MSENELNEERRDQRILQILFMYGIPTNEEEAMRVARLAYADGYLTGLDDRARPEGRAT